MKDNPYGKWYRLDNAATIFPAQNTKTWSNLFRFSLRLTEPVDPDVLREALEIVLPRFPALKVRIRPGLFWYYFEENPLPAPPVMPDVNNPCHRIRFNENDRYLFRVYYYGSTVAVDFYHALTDGHGGAVFTCTLAAQYLRLKGYDIPAGGFVLDLADEPSEAELEDAFVKNATSTGKLKRAEHFVYHSQGTKMPRHLVRVTSGTLDLAEVKALAAEKDVTVTELLAAVLLDLHIRKQRTETKKQKEVCVQIPIDLRRVYDSETLRNFTICLRVVIDPNLGDYSFDELLRQASLQLRLARDKNKLNAMITQNLGLQTNPLLRFMPLPVKNAGVGAVFAITGEQTTSALLTNLGPVDLPSAMQALTDKALFMPSPGIRTAARLGVTTLNGKLVITFADVYEERTVEREFFTALVKLGLHVKIECNRDD